MLHSLALYWRQWKSAGCVSNVLAAIGTLFAAAFSKSNSNFESNDFARPPTSLNFTQQQRSLHLGEGFLAWQNGGLNV